MPTTQYTPKWRFPYLARGQSMRDTRAVLQEIAETNDAGLTRIAAYVDQLATVIPAGQTVIGIDTDGTPYFDPTGSVTAPAGVGIDTDGTPYIVEWTHP
jgi:hypothetical protein